MNDTTAPTADAAAKTHSLRARLLAFLCAAIAAFAVMQGIGAYRGALQQADDLFDDHLKQMANSLRASVPRAPGADMDGEGGLTIQIWGPDGVQLFRSRPSTLPQSAVLGFSDIRVEGTLYRVYTVQTPLQTVQIAQDVSARNARARVLALRSALPVALMAPLLMLVVWWVVSRSLAPVSRVRRQLAARAAEDFSPLADTGLPDEVRPLVRELNALFGRVRAAFEAQKNFVADAAHELRSPLTALKLQAQALRRADVREDPAAHEAAVARLNLGIERAIRLVEQLLVLAREEAAAPGPTLGAGARAVSQVDLQEVLRLTVSDVLAQAQAAGIDLGVAAGAHTAPLFVAGQADTLRILLRNLLDNAIKYTPAPGRVDASLSVEGQEAVLSVDDSGPGIAPADRERVFDRFFRTEDAAATAATTGSGLGLAIVHAIAQRYGAQVRLTSSPTLGGLRVEVRLALLA
jgi:two-component system, OmpR family, sensor kinase